MSPDRDKRRQSMHRGWVMALTGRSDSVGGLSTTRRATGTRSGMGRSWETEMDTSPCKRHGPEAP